MVQQINENKNWKKILSFSFIFLLFIALIFAADYYTLPNISYPGGIGIDEHLVCRWLVGGADYDMFVPTKTSLEWNSFLTYASFVTIYACDECLNANDCLYSYDLCEYPMTCSIASCCADAPSSQCDFNSDCEYNYPDCDFSKMTCNGLNVCCVNDWDTIYSWETCPAYCNDGGGNYGCPVSCSDVNPW